MSIENNEVNSAPVIYDEDTKALMADLEAEGETFSKEEEKPSEQEEEKVEEQEEQKEDEVEVPTTEEEEDAPQVDRSKREPSTIPAWEHKVAEKKWQKETEILRQEIEQLKSAPKQTSAQNAQTIRDLAEAHGLALDEKQEQFFQALLAQAVPQDVTKKLEQFEQDKQVASLEQQFEQEFNDTVSAIKEKYGEVSSSTLADVKKTLHKLAFSETYAKVPLKKIFLAEQDTFKIQRVEHKESIIAPQAGRSRETTVDFSNVTDAEIDKMSVSDFEKYDEWLKGKQEKSGWR